MSFRNYARFASALVLAAGLVACGGGGGGGAPSPAPPSGSVPSPAPAPAPSPAPAPAPTPTPPPMLGTVGLTQARDFATLAFGRRFTTDRMGGAIQGSTEPDRTQVGFSYLAADHSYEVRLPGLPAGRIQPLFRLGDTFTVHRVPHPITGEQIASLELFRPGAQNATIALDHTSFASWKASRADPANPNRILQDYGDFAYGVPTGDVPGTGLASYRLFVYGDVGFVLGSGTLVFDFAAGRLSGGMAATLNDGIGGLAEIGRVEIVDPLFPAGAGGFSGTLALNGSRVPSSFEGRFTGPGASELMARWTARVPDPHNPGRMVALAGLWVGRRS